MLDLILLTTKPRSKLSLARKKYTDYLLGRKPYCHSQITRSLVNGLAQQNEVSWDHAFSYSGERARTIYAPHHGAAVRAGIQAKRQGLCERLLVGPEVIIEAPEIDVAILASEWHKDYRAEYRLPSMADRYRVWAAGVDPFYWVPGADRRKVLIYDKKRRADADAVQRLLDRAGFETIILRYGFYTLDEYRDLLRECFANVVVARSESQGVAIHESWAADVPTFVARCDSIGTIPKCSAAPYLTEQTGAFWDSQDELPDLLRTAHLRAPRQWVLENNTDKIAVQKLLKIALP